MTDNSNLNRELDALVAEKVLGLMPCSNWKETSRRLVGVRMLDGRRLIDENCFKLNHRRDIE